MTLHRSLVFLLPCFLASPARGDDVTDDGNQIEEEVNSIVEEAAAAVEEADEAARGIEVEIEDIVADEVHRQHAELERHLRKGGADLIEERIHEPGDDGLRDVLIERDPFEMDEGSLFLDADIDLLLDFEDGGEGEDARGRRPRREEEVIRRVERARVPGPGPERRKDMKAIEKQVEKLEKEIHKLHEARRKMLRGPKRLPEGGPEDGGPRGLRGPARVSPDPQPRPEDPGPRARGRRLGPDPGFEVPVPPPPGPPGQRGPRPQMEAIRRELHEVRRGLERIERLIGDLHRARGEARGRQPDLFGQGGPGGDGPPRPPAPPRRQRQPGQPGQPAQPGQPSAPAQPGQPAQPGEPGPGPGNPYFVPRAPGGGPNVFNRVLHREHVPHPPVAVPPPAPFHAPLPAPRPHPVD